MLRALLLAIAFAASGTAHAIDTERAFEDPALQARYENITRELRCLVCQNETIADSNATLAGDLRREVREMIAAGKTDDQIRQFMLDRYGDFVLYRPRMTPLTFLLWSAPVLLVALGALAVVRVIRRRSTEADTDPEGQEDGQS
ncbi:MAG TPA: cytochrome c-type biogenesis protein CcmH [Steroidobacteraceae bacterium]|nr:cytochrome c-type biogenesis protein CcmH [Steroidobacteraceae bacterium]